jgi:hypothetical protein
VSTHYASSIKEIGANGAPEHTSKEEIHYSRTLQALMTSNTGKLQNHKDAIII